jgi:hypothetical protein
MRVVASVAALTLAAAQLSGFPHGGGACVTEEDCSLGGICGANLCVCDVWFTGTHCDLLNLQPPPDTQGGTCGAGFDSFYSWGGRTIAGGDGLFHSYVSFMCNHKTLDEWTTASSSAHLTASTPAGPFTWFEGDCDGNGICTPPVIPWSHNTVALRSPTSPEYQIWHIGDGLVEKSVWYPCFNRSDVGQRPGSPKSSREAGTWSPSTFGAGPGNTAYVAASESPNGPWTREFNNQGVAINFTGSWTSGLAGNPAPLLMPDGSARLYFTATPCPPNSGALVPNCIAVATAAEWSGPYTMNGATRPVTYPESEDPFVFADKRGNFHLLTNVNTYHRRCAQGVPCGGHAWSRDGLLFSNLTVGAFGPIITLSNGTVWSNAYVERPLVTLAADGTPLAFYVGMGRTSYSDSCNWPQLFCQPGMTTCGPTLPPPPPPTQNVRLMNGGQCLMFSSATFPCSGTGTSEGCPVVLGSCGDAGSVWAWDGAGGTVVSVALPSVALDVDCNAVVPHTVVKALASGAAPLRFVNGTGGMGVIQFQFGAACLNGGQGPPNKPCGPAGEVYLQTQIQLAPCADATAQGWTLQLA